MPNRIVTAAWVLPIATPPLRHGWVEIAEGRITAVGTGRPPGPAEDLGDVAILPGLVNAHTHLELSWMAGRVPPAANMNDWIRVLIRERRTNAPGPGEEARAARAAAIAMRDLGTVLVGDISNGLAHMSAIREAGLGGVVFHEVLGFNVAEPAAVVRDAWARVDAVARETPGPSDEGGLAFSVVAHAPYSVSPSLFREIARAARDTPLAVHLAESIEEMVFVRTGGGPIRKSLEALGVWTDTWTVPGSDPVAYLDSLAYFRPGVLVVHGVHLTAANLDHLRRAGATLVTCPRSNEWVGSGPPPIAQFYASGIPVAIGTDSLASAPTLSLWDELATLRRLAPEVSAASLLASATRVGAAALQRDRDYGTLEPGKRAALVAVRVPAGEGDVEEYLVSGVRPDAVRRL